MRKETKEAFVAICRTDKSITEEQISAAIEVLESASKVSRGAHGDVEAKVLSRREVAKIFHIHPKKVDEYCRQGVFMRVYFPGAKRSCGILRVSVDNALRQLEEGVAR